MKKNIKALCSIIIAFSICIAIFGVGATVNDDVTIATMRNYHAPKSETTTSDALGGVIGDVVGGLGGSDSSGGLGDLLGGVDTSGLGDAIGGFGDTVGGVGDILGGAADGFGSALGDVLGGLGGASDTVSTTINTTAPVQTTKADINLIIPVPVATQTTEAETATETTTTSGETVDFAATSNPYTKPTATFSAGDEDETIKWLQWIFIYTGYGLSDNDITGVLDEDTVAVVKKLQKDNKLTIDGNITEDVIKAAEVLYYQSMLGEDVSAIEVSSEATTGESVSNQATVEGNENSVPVALLIIVLVIIWVLVIGGIVVLFIIKKKKKTVAKNVALEKTIANPADGNKAEKSDKTEIKSLSDLFEEAEKKKK